MLNLFSHVKWFVDADTVEASQSLSGIELIIVIIALLVGISILGFIQNFKLYQSYEVRFDKKLKRFKGYAALVVRYCLGIMLLINAWYGWFWSPDFVVTGSFLTTLSWLSAGLGILLIAGVFSRLTALTVIVIYVLSIFGTPFEQLMEHVEILGMAGYVLFAGGGKWQISNLEQFDFHWLDRHRHLALPSLRLGAGLSLVVLAFSEKLIGTNLAEQFLAIHDWNFMEPFGLTDRSFIIFAGTSELIIGLGLIFNRASRLLTLAVFGLFVLTAALLGFSEVGGHLFGLALLVAVWINYPHATVNKRFNG